MPVSGHRLMRGIMDEDRRRTLQDERYRDWQQRRRGPGDLVTWAVVLGGVMSVFMFFSSAYDGSTLLGGAVTILIIAWILIVWLIGGVNVVSILWGRTISDDFDTGKTPLVLIATAVLAAVAIAIPLLDLTSTLEFGWYGVLSGMVGVIYLIMLGAAGRRQSS